MGWVGPLSFQTHAYYSLGFFFVFFWEKKESNSFRPFFFLIFLLTFESAH